MKILNMMLNIKQRVISSSRDETLYIDISYLEKKLNTHVRKIAHEMKQANEK